MSKPVIETTDNTERRTHTVEMRVKDASYGKKTPTMEGYAANFNSLSENLGGFREMLMPGCFKNAIANSDVRGLFNHDPNLILGRNTSGTLRLVEDEKGLRFEIDPPDTTYSKDLQVSMQRGDVNQCSFSFTVAEDGDSWQKDSDGLWIRTISNVARLFDVSPVTYPAYATTSCAVRSMIQKENELAEEEQRRLAEANEAEVKRVNEVRRRRLQMAGGGTEQRVDMGYYAGRNTAGSCTMCNEEGCMCSDCENVSACNLLTKANGGICTKCMNPKCKCLQCVNTDNCKMMKLCDL